MNSPLLRDLIYRRKGRIQVLLWNQTCARGADGEVDDARRHLRLAEPKALVTVLVGLRTSSSPPMELSKLSSNNTSLFVRKVADLYGVSMLTKQERDSADRLGRWCITVTSVLYPRFFSRGARGRTERLNKFENGMRLVRGGRARKAGNRQ